jgi:hypothetical protein
MYICDQLNPQTILPLVVIKNEDGWAPMLVWTDKENKNFCPRQEWKPDSRHPAHSLLNDWEQTEEEANKGNSVICLRVLSHKQLFII